MKGVKGFFFSFFFLLVCLYGRSEYFYPTFIAKLADRCDQLVFWTRGGNVCFEVLLMRNEIARYLAYFVIILNNRVWCLWWDGKHVNEQYRCVLQHCICGGCSSVAAVPLSHAMVVVVVVLLWRWGWCCSFELLYSWALSVNIVGVRMRVGGLALLGHDRCGVVPFLWVFWCKHSVTK